ncbi:MAG: murein L,D-transpeptidase catalytic domain family protein [Niabella sp.]
MKQIYSRISLAVILVSFALTQISWSVKESIGLGNNQGLFLFNIYLLNNEFHSDMSTTFVYEGMHLDEKGLSPEAFEMGLAGMHNLLEEGLLENDSILTIVDFNQPSYEKRMYVMDIKNMQLLFQTWAAHGKNTGKEWAERFSNANESYKSSLGFYLTDEPYNGSNGYSLKLRGLEKNLNDKALQRGIVIHGAYYVSQDFINRQGYIGRSHGCPAVPMELSKPIINRIRSGSCLFIYNKNYHPTGLVLNPKFSHNS